MNTIQQIVQILLLPTNERSRLFLQKETNRFHYLDNDRPQVKDSEVRQNHFWYVLSNDEIKNWKQGDWFMWKNEVHQFHSDAGYGIKTYTQYKESDGSSLLVNFSNARGKIISTNDTKCKTYLGMNTDGCSVFEELYNELPQTPDAFIHHWIDAGCPELVNVEYEEYMTDGWVPSYNNPDNSNLDEAAEMDIRPVITKDNMLVFSLIFKEKEFTKEDMICFAEYKSMNLLKHSDSNGRCLGSEKIFEMWLIDYHINK